MYEPSNATLGQLDSIQSYHLSPDNPLAQIPQELYTHVLTGVGGVKVKYNFVHRTVLFHNLGMMSRHVV